MFKANLDPMLSGIARSITYTDWDSVQSLLDDVTDLHIRQMSRLALVYIGEYKHVLSIPRHGFLRVDKAPDGTLDHYSILNLRNFFLYRNSRNPNLLFQKRGLPKTRNNPRPTSNPLRLPYLPRPSNSGCIYILDIPLPTQSHLPYSNVA